MGWDEAHDQSEALASRAHLATVNGKAAEGVLLYQKAADAEAVALELLGDQGVAPRTYAITAISAAALYTKGERADLARAVAEKALANPALPTWATGQLREFL